MQIEQARTTTVADLWSEIEREVLSARALEQGAQTLAAALYGRFEESVVITRVFVTVPFGELPESNQSFVRGRLEPTHAAGDLKPTTPVLSLIGSYGQEEEWRDRRRSKGYVGIPLVSSSFVSEIPMMSRLLKEFGVPLDWVDSHDSEIIINTIGNQAGLFFIDDAETATDSQGRNIIAARDFVHDRQVKSVFGVGGAYPTGQIALIITFCRDAITRVVAERFVTLAAFFLSKTKRYAKRGRIFCD